jgi:hypothetical protein
MVIVRGWQVFPLDFTGYWSGWETLARILLGIAFVGVILDTVTQVVGLNRTAHHRSEGTLGSHG